MKMFRVKLEALIPGGLPFHVAGGGAVPGSGLLVSSYLRITGNRRVATHSMPQWVSAGSLAPPAAYGTADQITLEGNVEAETPGEAVVFALCDLDAKEFDTERATVEVERIA